MRSGPVGATVGAPQTLGEPSAFSHLAKGGSCVRPGVSASLGFVSPVPEPETRAGLPSARAEDALGPAVVAGPQPKQAPETPDGSTKRPRSAPDDMPAQFSPTGDQGPSVLPAAPAAQDSGTPDSFAPRPRSAPDDMPAQFSPTGDQGPSVLPAATAAQDSGTPDGSPQSSSLSEDFVIGRLFLPVLPGTSAQDPETLAGSTKRPRSESPVTGIESRGSSQPGTPDDFPPRPGSAPAAMYTPLLTRGDQGSAVVAAAPAAQDPGTSEGLPPSAPLAQALDAGDPEQENPSVGGDCSYYRVGAMTLGIGSTFPYPLIGGTVNVFLLMGTFFYSRSKFSSFEGGSRTVNAPWANRPPSRYELNKDTLDITTILAPVILSLGATLAIDQKEHLHPNYHTFLINYVYFYCILSTALDGSMAIATKCSPPRPPMNFNVEEAKRMVEKLMNKEFLNFGGYLWLGLIFLVGIIINNLVLLPRLYERADSLGIQLQPGDRAAINAHILMKSLCLVPDLLVPKLDSSQQKEVAKLFDENGFVNWLAVLLLNMSLRALLKSNEINKITAAFRRVQNTQSVLSHEV